LKRRGIYELFPEKNKNSLWNFLKIFSHFLPVDFNTMTNHSNKPTIMETSKILSADSLDILFDGRNKEYGAYDLRKTYNNRIKVSITGMFLVCAFCLGTAMVANSKGKKNNELVITDMILSNVNDEKKPEPPPPAPPPKQEPPKVEMSKFVAPIIVKDDEVTPEDEIKDVAILEDTKIGTINQEGKIDDGAVDPPVEGPTNVVAAPKKQRDIDSIFIDVQYEAIFPGGPDGWRKYLERNLNKDLPSENGAPANDYTVIVSFIVDRFGVISDVKAENDPGYGTKEEAIKIIRKSPTWEPAVQNGTKVVHRQKQKITFRVSVD
jgi:protein TonB